MTRALIILMLLIAGCTGDGASPPPSTPQADQPASPPALALTVNAGPGSNHQARHRGHAVRQQYDHRVTS